MDAVSVKEIPQSSLDENNSFLSSEKIENVISPDLDIFIYTNENDIVHEETHTQDMIDIVIDPHYVDNSLDIDEDLDIYFDTIYTKDENSDFLEKNSILEKNETNVPFVPEIVFIVPYRDRKDDLDYFLNKMNYIMSNNKYKYEIAIMHQNDTRPFNRGAVKNIGFLYVKEKYPDAYKSITLVFNDVDTTPNEPIFDYKTVGRKIKHFFGFNFALGGIVGITGEDFELINGYPNFWQWGLEDNILQTRVLEYNPSSRSNKMEIDRSEFKDATNTSSVYRIHNIQYRKMNHNDVLKYKNNTKEGIDSIYDVNMQKSILPINIDSNKCVHVEFIDINKFDIEYSHDSSRDFIHDGSTKLKINKRRGVPLQFL